MTALSVVRLGEEEPGGDGDLGHDWRAACLRSMGFAARYVSGYVVGSAAAPSRASHAWASVWLPSGGGVTLSRRWDAWA
ncbi:transglutaminase domain-containing protein [Sorangium sp. So ce1024]|uniref:transglutaminase domain-containing protein n=1 Tax=Sorangium sp. So ce1024 TaxID=3133327 RepID=UPI003F0DB944